MYRIYWVFAIFISYFGVAAEQLDEVKRAIVQGEYTGIDSVLVYQDDQLVADYYFNQFSKATLHQTRSTFKSITGLIAAIAIDQKLLKPQEKLLPLLSEFTSVNYQGSDKSQLRIIDVLNMTSGLNCSEMPGTGPYHEEAVDEGSEPLSYSVNIDMKYSPGEVWQYCNANSFLLGAAVSAALKRAGKNDIFHFAKVHLLDPLGIKNYRMYKSPDGYLYGQGNSRFLPEDLAKFGNLLLNSGKWQGKQVLSKHAVSRILNSGVETHWSWTSAVAGQPQVNASYSYQWFKTQFLVNTRRLDVVHSWGNGGQFIFVIPDANSVVVFTGSNYGNIEKQQQAFQLMARYLLPYLLSTKG